MSLCDVYMFLLDMLFYSYSFAAPVLHLTTRAMEAEPCASQNTDAAEEGWRFYFQPQSHAGAPQSV